MKQVHRQGDATTGHGCWPFTAPASYSPNVFANNRGVVRRGDTTIPHTCPDIPDTHPGTYMAWRNVYANSRPVQGVGDPIDCGDQAAKGSPNVYVID